MDLIDYLRILRRRWPLILLCLLLGGGASTAATLLATPKYESAASLYIAAAQTDTSEAYQGGLLSAQRVTSYAIIAMSDDLAREVISDLDVDVPVEELANSVTAEAAPDTVILELRVTDASPEQAQIFAQTYAEALADRIRTSEPGSDGRPLVTAKVWDEADYPANPSSPNALRNISIGLLLGLVLGLALAVMRDLLDTTIKTAGDLAETSSAPLLGLIHFDNATKSAPLITSLDSHAPRVEAFRVLRTNLQFVEVDRPDKVFVVTSPLPEEGKTTTSVNLAIALAQAGMRTLLIEGDLRRPRAAATLQMDNAIGVTSVLVGALSLSDALQEHIPSGLHILGAGPIPPNPADLVQSDSMAEMLNDLRTRYDTIIIDAPPLLPVTDAALLASQADGAIVVVRHGRTTKDHVAQAIERLDQVDANLIGVLLNMVPARRVDGYGYGYGYAPAPVTTSAPPATPRSLPGRRVKNRRLGVSPKR